MAASSPSGVSGIVSSEETEGERERNDVGVLDVEAVRKPGYVSL